MHSCTGYYMREEFIDNNMYVATYLFNVFCLSVYFSKSPPLPILPFIIQASIQHFIRSRTTISCRLRPGQFGPATSVQVQFRPGQMGTGRLGSELHKLYYVLNINGSWINERLFIN